VTVNGATVEDLGVRAVWGRDKIQVDGREIPPPSERVYLMMNKPFGYISSLRDPEGRPVAADLLAGITQRLYPAGRLDFDSMGLLLFTNDGEWAHRLTHPRYRIPRTYKVTVHGKILDEALDALARGVQVDEGSPVSAKVTLIRRGGPQSLIRMTIHQGKNRQVRRMLQALGHEVIHLVRIGFGPLQLGNLKVGQYRFLDPEEVEAMRQMAGLH
jgi:pseudouridine synthase